MPLCHIEIPHTSQARSNLRTLSTNMKNLTFRGGRPCSFSSTGLRFTTARLELSRGYLGGYEPAQLGWCDQVCRATNQLPAMFLLKGAWQPEGLPLKAEERAPRAARVFRECFGSFVRSEALGELLVFFTPPQMERPRFEQRKCRKNVVLHKQMQERQDDHLAGADLCIHGLHRCYIGGTNHQWQLVATGLESTQP